MQSKNLIRLRKNKRKYSRVEGKTQIFTQNLISHLPVDWTLETRYFFRFKKMWLQFEKIASLKTNPNWTNLSKIFRLPPPPENNKYQLTSSWPLIRLLQSLYNISDGGPRQNRFSPPGYRMGRVHHRGKKSGYRKWGSARITFQIQKYCWIFWLASSLRSIFVPLFRITWVRISTMVYGQWTHCYYGDQTIFFILQISV